MTRIDYYKYIQSKRWKRVAHAAKVRVGWRCEGCRRLTSNLHAHHLTYERLGNERASDIRVLCAACHADVHATMPPDLAEVCIRAGGAEGDAVLDPFGGAGTTALVANRLGRDAILIELNPDYAELARWRIVDDAPMFASVEVLA